MTTPVKENPMPPTKPAVDIRTGDLIHADGMNALTVTDTWPAQHSGDYVEIDVQPTPGEDPWSMGPGPFTLAVGAAQVECTSVIPRPTYRLYYRPGTQVRTATGDPR